MTAGTGKPRQQRPRAPARWSEEALSRSGRKGADAATVLRIAAEDEKGRYEVDTETSPTRIRAAYGHSIPVRSAEHAATPPDVLFHGTARRFLDSILRDGLKAMGRLRVHLSSDRGTAVDVGRRRDAEPVVLRIDAGRMHSDGHRFFLGPAGLFLVARVPPENITIAPDA